MFHYFGFGSNMSLVSLKAKGIQPRKSCRAVLPGWRLRFNVQHFFRHEGGVGNIEYTGNPADRVIGVLHELTDDALVLLDGAEACGHGYDRITVDVSIETNDGGRMSALTYVGMTEFIDESCLPSQRYLNIVVDGACQAQLDKDYIQALSAQPTHVSEDHPPFIQPAGEYPAFDVHSLSQYPLYTAMYGAVFDMSKARPLHNFLRSYFGGKDMTLFHLKRLDSSNTEETVDDIRKGNLNQNQRRYLNAYLNEYAREYRYVGQYNY